jgi:hypothetical protein
MENNYISYLVIQIPVRVGAVSTRQISIGSVEWNPSKMPLIKSY